MAEELSRRNAKLLEKLDKDEISKLADKANKFILEENTVLELMKHLSRHVDGESNILSITLGKGELKGKKDVTIAIGAGEEMSESLINAVIGLRNLMGVSTLVSDGREQKIEIPK